MMASGLAVAQSASSPHPDPKAAALAYRASQEYEHKNDLMGALASLQQALQLAPGNLQYASALGELKQRLLQQHLESADQALAHDDVPEAIAQFQAALNIDPGNQAARQRLTAAQARLPRAESALERVAASTEIELKPRAGTVTFHFSGDSRQLLEQVATSFGLSATFDDNFRPRPLTLDLRDATFAQALGLATRLAHAMWTPRSATQVFFATETPENHRQFDRISTREFYVPDFATAQELNDLGSALRGIFDVRNLVLNSQRSLITVRAPKPVLDSVTTFIAGLSTGRPQVLLDVQVYQIDQTLLRNLGVQIPTQFQMIQIPPSVIALLSQGNIQQQIQNLINSGGLTPENLQAIQALLAQLQAQQASGLSSLLNQPFITFGHGQTLFAITYPGSFTANFRFDNSTVRQLEHITLRAAQGDTASMLIGTRFPVLTSTFGFSSNVAGGGLANFPSFNFEDLGITLKAKPQVHYSPLSLTSVASSPAQPEAAVTLDLELSIKSLAGASINSIPVIANRSYKGSVRLNDGEPAVVVGSISRSQIKSLSGIPGLGRIPALGRVFSQRNDNNSEDEVLVVVTPHVVRLPGAANPAPIYLPAGQ